MDAYDSLAGKKTQNAEAHPSNTTSFKSEEEQMKTTKQKFASVGALALMVPSKMLDPNGDGLGCHRDSASLTRFKEEDDVDV